MFRKITSVLVVQDIEPVLPFWEAIGFRKTVEVPHGNRLGFVILEGDGVQLMYQTIDSVRDDEKGVLDGPRPIEAGALFIEVEDVDALSKRIPPGTGVIVQRRTTFYGATETIVRDPAGNVVTFAQMQK
ncbi:MAG TPA: VOC family protein [Thermoanaerobaculia bacterium]|nr:VOC family protein [Thermoanaerobaculia bacterium]